MVLQGGYHHAPHLACGDLPISIVNDFNHHVLRIDVIPTGRALPRDEALGRAVAVRNLHPQHAPDMLSDRIVEDFRTGEDLL